MEEYQEVVFAEDTRVTTGSRVALFKSGIARKVHPEIVAAALGLGAEMAKPVEPDVGLRAVPDPLKKPRKKRVSKRDA
jgi:hypothetical protein